MMKNESQSLSLDLIDKYCLKNNPLFNVVPIKATYHFKDLDSNELKDLEEFANIENGTIERWLLVPDCMSLGVLGFTIQRAFGLTPFAFTPSFLLPPEEQKVLFPTLEDALQASGSIFDNPFDYDYFEELQMLASVDKDFVPSVTSSMLSLPSISYETARKKVREEVKDVRKNGLEIDGKKVPFAELEGSPSILYEKTKDKDFDWCDELCKFIEVKDVLIPEGSPRPRFSKRFTGQRLTSLTGKRRGYPFAHKLYLCTFFEDEDSFVFEVERPKDISSLFNDGFVSLESYLDSISFVTREMRADCICKKGYDLFCFDEMSYYQFIMLLHSPMRDTIIKEAQDSGWSEPNMELKRIFR